MTVYNKMQIFSSLVISFFQPEMKTQSERKKEEENKIENKKPWNRGRKEKRKT